MHQVAYLLFCLWSVSICAHEAIFCDESERPVEGDIELNDVVFVGQTYFSPQTLSSLVAHPHKKIVDWLQLSADAESIARRFHDRGYFAAKVRVCLKRASGNHFVSQFNIEAGHRAQIRDIRVRGNHRVAKHELIADFVHQSPSWNEFFKKTGYFNGQQIDEDSRRLLSQYHRRGFLDAEVKRVYVEVSPDYSEIELFFDVHEGGTYALAQVAFTGDLPDDESSESLAQKISIKPNDVLDLVALQQEVDALLDPFREDGYAMVRVDPRIRIEKHPGSPSERGSIAVTYNIIKGRQFRLKKVHIEGNEATYDRVILRDVSIAAGALYRQSELKLIQQRLMSLGYFSKVELLLLAGESDDELDLLIRVSERPTWFFSVLPMVVANEGFIIAGFVAYHNIFGTGLAASLSLQLSSLRQLFELALFEPRLIDTYHSLLGEVHRRQLQYRMFRTSALGGGAHYKIPMGDYFKLGLGLKIDHVDIDQLREIEIVKQVAEIPLHDWRNVLFASVAFELNNQKGGVSIEMSASYAGWLTLSSLEFIDLGMSARLYYCPFKGFKLKSRTQLGILLRPSARLLPLSERYFLGGQGSIRGYAPRSIAPALMSPQTDLALQIGGTCKFIQSLEFEFPFWPRYAFSGYVFTDAGNAFLPDSSLNDIDLYWSVGFGIIAEILHLPLRFEVGIPLSPSVALIPFDIFFGFSSDL